MRTLIDIDERLIKKAMALSKVSTKKETVRIALEELIRLKLRQQLKELAGSGAVEMTLDELNELRGERQNTHSSLKGPQN